MQGSQDPPRKKQNFRNEEDFIFAKKPPKKKIFPPQQAVVARFARASLTATERRGGSILRDNKKRKGGYTNTTKFAKNGNVILSLAPYAPRTVQNQNVFQKQGLMQRRVIFKKRQNFCSFGQVVFFGCKMQGYPKTLPTLFFCGAKKLI